MMGNWERERERNVLINDALNTFYLRLYGVRHMVKDHSDSEKGNSLPPHRLIGNETRFHNKNYLFKVHPADRTLNTSVFDSHQLEY